MPTTRRQFLQQLGAAGVVSLGAVPPAFLSRAARASEDSGSNPDKRILVLIQLAGGNDGLNTVILYQSEDYYKARPGIGIPRGNVLKMTDELGLHPAMEGFRQLYDDGVLAVVQGVGYANPDRSHFRSMDIWQSAYPEIENTHDGWIGRALDQTLSRHSDGLPALSFGSEKLPLALVSERVNVPNVNNLDGFRWQLGRGTEAQLKHRRATIDRIVHRPAPAGSELDFLRKTAMTAFTTADKLEAITKGYRPAVDYPANGLAQKLKTVAQIIAGDLGTQIFYVSLDGFDTHSQQQGAHQSLLGELSSAVRAFYSDLKGHGLDDRVLVSTFSEFGRRVEENGSLGTDHGAASQMFVVTPRPAHAGVHGDHPSLTDLHQGDLKFHTDFRSVYATILEKWLDIPSESVLGQKFPMLDFV